MYTKHPKQNYITVEPNENPKFHRVIFHSSERNTKPNIKRKTAEKKKSRNKSNEVTKSRGRRRRGAQGGARAACSLLPGDRVHRTSANVRSLFTSERARRAAATARAIMCPPPEIENLLS